MFPKAKKLTKKFLDDSEDWSDFILMVIFQSMFLCILLTFITIKLDKENVYLPCTVDLFKPDNSIDYTNHLFGLKQ